MSDGTSPSLGLTGLLLSGLLLGTGCASPDADSEDAETSDSALGEAATITFDGSWSERVSGELQKGKKVRIVYDVDRLTQCRGDLNGGPGWSITGFWRIGEGPIHTFPAGGLGSSPGQAPSFTLDGSGDLALWFQNTSRWGCSAYDSNLGDNYHFEIAPAAHEPGWIGNVRYAIDRMTCDGICDSSLRPVSGEIAYDTWARQRAAVRALTFEVWKRGVTDREDPSLWEKLDVQVHSRVAGTQEFASRYVSFDKRLGDNARYAVDLRQLDPLAGQSTIADAKDCPSFELTADDAYVGAIVELFVTVNGVELRPSGPGSVYRVRYTNYRDLYAPCVQ